MQNVRPILIFNMPNTIEQKKVCDQIKHTFESIAGHLHNESPYHSHLHTQAKELEELRGR